MLTNLDATIFDANGDIVAEIESSGANYAAHANAALIVKCVNNHAALVNALEGLVKAFKPFTTKPIGGEDSPARLDQDDQIAAHATARKLLEELKGI